MESFNQINLIKYYKFPKSIITIKILNNQKKQFENIKKMITINTKFSIISSDLQAKTFEEIIKDIPFHSDR